MFIRILCVTAVAALAVTAPVRAGFVVAVESKVVNPGDTTVTLDVTIRGTEWLDFFAGEFVLTAAGGAPVGGVRFTPDAPFPLTGYALPDANSFAIQEWNDSGSSPVSVYQTGGWADDTYLMSDGTLDF